MSFRLREILLKTLFAAACAFAALPLLSQTAIPIVANDNRVLAGLLKDGVLTVSLELRKGNWHPEREDGDAIPTYAFGEGGKPLQVPGPAIRVPQGVTIGRLRRSRCYYSQSRPRLQMGRRTRSLISRPPTPIRSGGEVFTTGTLDFFRHDTNDAAGDSPVCWYGVPFRE